MLLWASACLISICLHQNPTAVTKDSFVISKSQRREVLGGDLLSDRMARSWPPTWPKAGLAGRDGGGRCFQHSAQPCGWDSSGQTGNPECVGDALGHVEGRGPAWIGLGALSTVQVPGDVERLSPRLDPFQMERGPGHL